MTPIFEEMTPIFAWPFLLSAVTVIGVILTLFLAHVILERLQQTYGGYRFRNQLIMVGLGLAGGVFMILTLPISENLRGQLLTLIGILLSAALTLASTTLLSNALAGLMLRVIRNFRMGDFIRVGEHFGRVSERGLFHTEIQTEDRELTTLPNLYLVTNPSTTLRSSGTIISATVTLGYDVPHAIAEQLLLEAAKEASLEDPFVHTLELGNYSVTYRVAGLLTDVKQVVSVRSRLHNCVLDALHRGGVEIASPTLMNTRAYPVERRYMPDINFDTVVPSPESMPAEEVVFDKAEEAESLEKMQIHYKKLVEQIKTLEDTLKKTKDETEKKSVQNRIFLLKGHQERLEHAIEDKKGAEEEGQ